MPETAPDILLFTAEERRIFAKPAWSNVADCARANLIVQDGPYKGSPLRLDVSPFLAGPMNSFSDPAVREVGVCGSLQVGKTLFLAACLAYSVICRRGNRLLAMPTGKAMEKALVHKWAPLISGSPALKKRLAKKIKASGVEFKDGTGLIFASAETPSDRATITIMDVLLDEEDLYMPGSSANPVEDFRGRARSYGWQGKVARTCQPKGAESSIFNFITREADQLYCYEAKCPACQEYQILKPENIIVLEDCKDPKEIRRRRLARYQCACGYLWSDHVRDLAVAAGRWGSYKYSDEEGFAPAQPTPGATSHGYHMPALLSRSVSLSTLVARKLTAEQSEDPVKLESYYNDDLALPYTPVSLQTSEEKILALREPWLPPLTIPHGALALTCGIDMQKRGFWYLVRAWMPNMASYIIDYGQLPDWAEIAKLCFSTWYPVLGTDNKPSGEVRQIWRAALDTGGTEKDDGVTTYTEEAYLWIRANGGGVIHACKGASRRQSTPVRSTMIDKLPHSGRPIPGGLSLNMLDTISLKDLAFSRLLNPESASPIHLHAECDQDLAYQLSAEMQVREKGKLIWKAKHGRNHLTDCLMLTEAAASSAWSPSLPLIALQQQRAAQAPPRKTQGPPAQPRGRGMTAAERIAAARR